MITNLTYHAQVERIGRMAAIEETLGFTSICMEYRTHDSRHCITTSGVLIVRALDSDKVITAYALRPDQVIREARRAGKKQVPPKLYKRVQKNMERHSFLYEISY